jgi:hypothetical protein
MSYLGNTPEVYQFDAATQKFNGTGSQTVFTLNRRILDVDDVDYPFFGGASLFFNKMYKM